MALSSAVQTHRSVTRSDGVETSRPCFAEGIAFRWIAAAGAVAIAATVLAVFGLGPRFGELAGAGSHQATNAATQLPIEINSTATATAPVDVEGARLAVVEAVNTDTMNFGGIYLDAGNTLVIEYVGANAGRAAVDLFIPASPSAGSKLIAAAPNSTKLQHRSRTATLMAS